MAPNSLKPFISHRLSESVKDPILYIPTHGGRAYGLKAEAFPLVCDVWIRARDAGALHHTQAHLAERADILKTALAGVGIIALVDEATGYETVRKRYELHELLSKYLVEERLAWAKKFPDVFYRQIYKLKGWEYPSGGGRTQLIGKITNKIVYERLPEGVLEELIKRNPVNPNTRRRRAKHHQYLSSDIGQPDLRDHLLQIIALMRASSTWDGFMKLLDAAFPVRGQQESLKFLE